jgi:hypothetical protein
LTVRADRGDRALEMVAVQYQGALEDGAVLVGLNLEGDIFADPN